MPDARCPVPVYEPEAPRPCAHTALGLDGRIRVLVGGGPGPGLGLNIIAEREFATRVSECRPKAQPCDIDSESRSVAR